MHSRMPQCYVNREMQVSISVMLSFCSFSSRKISSTQATLARAAADLVEAEEPSLASPPVALLSFVAYIAAGGFGWAVADTCFFHPWNSHQVVSRRVCLGRSFRRVESHCFLSDAVVGVDAVIARDVTVVVDRMDCTATYSDGPTVETAGVEGVAGPMCGQAGGSYRVTLGHRLREHRVDLMYADAFDLHAFAAKRLLPEIGLANSHAEHASRPEGSSFVTTDAAK